MQRGMRKCTWDVIYCILSVITAWVLHGCLCAAQPQVTRRSLTDIYNSGRLWLSTRELGIHKCTMYGVFETASLDLDGKPIADAPPKNITYTMDIWYRLKSNETHATVRSPSTTERSFVHPDSGCTCHTSTNHSNCSCLFPLAAAPLLQKCTCC